MKNIIVYLFLGMTTSVFVTSCKVHNLEKTNVTSLDIINISSPADTVIDVSKSRLSFWNKFDAISLPQRTLPFEEQQFAWVAVINKLETLFWEYQGEKKFIPDVQFIINEFGRRNMESDIKIILLNACLFFPPVLTPTHGLINLDNEKPETVMLAKRHNAIMYEYRIVFAKYQAEIYFNQNDLFERYYNALVWSWLYFGSPQRNITSLEVRSNSLRSKFFTAPPTDYWWYIREALVLLHATSQSKLIQERTTNGVEKAVAAWNSYYDWNVMWLKPDSNQPVWTMGLFPNRLILRDTWFSSLYDDVDYKSLALIIPDVPFDNWPDELSIPDVDFLLVHWLYGYGGRSLIEVLQKGGFEVGF